jgi:hypothetical protein
MHSTLLAMHDAFEARWKAAGGPDGATELCMWDMQRIIDELPNHRPVNAVLIEATELLEEWSNVGAPASAEEVALIQAVKGLLPTIRVQMVSDGIPAYQNDFNVQDLALATAERLASGCTKSQKISVNGDLVRYKLKTGYIRAYAIPA